MTKTCARCDGPRLWGGSFCARCGYARLDWIHPHRSTWSIRRELMYLHAYCLTGHAHVYHTKEAPLSSVGRVDGGGEPVR